MAVVSINAGAVFGMIPFKGSLYMRQADADDALQHRMRERRARGQDEFFRDAVNPVRVKRRFIADRLSAALHPLGKIRVGGKQHLPKRVLCRREPRR